MVGFGVLGVLIVTRQPHNRIGWLCVAIAALISPFLGSSTVFLNCSIQKLINLPGLSYLVWLQTFSPLAITLLFFLLPLWFPDGRFISAGWRRFALIIYSLLILASLIWAIWPGEMANFTAEVGKSPDNPFGLAFEPSSGLNNLVRRIPVAILLCGLLIANLSLIDRWRRSDKQTRQQIKVVAYFLVVIGTIYMLFELTGQILFPTIHILPLWIGGLYYVLLVLLWLGFPISIGVAVLKYRLYNIDFFIRRTLVYGLLTLTLGLAYYGGVTLLQSVFTQVSGQKSAVAIVISTLGIAALFSPLRRRIQDFIDRLFYRRKYDAMQAMASFAALAREEVEVEEITKKLLAIVEETVQPEHASLWIRPAREK